MTVSLLILVEGVSWAEVVQESNTVPRMPEFWVW
jgi:hypothetical protein